MLSVTACLERGYGDARRVISSATVRLHAAQRRMSALHNAFVLEAKTTHRLKLTRLSSCVVRACGIARPYVYRQKRR
jgi:hypothetical protein